MGDERIGGERQRLVEQEQGEHVRRIGDADRAGEREGEEDIEAGLQAQKAISG